MTLFTRRPDTKFLISQGCSFAQAFGILERGTRNTCSGPIPSNIQSQTESFLQQEAAKIAPAPTAPAPAPAPAPKPAPRPAPRRTRLSARQLRIERSRRKTATRRRKPKPARTIGGIAIDQSLAREIGF